MFTIIVVRIIRGVAHINTPPQPTHMIIIIVFLSFFENALECNRNVFYQIMLTNNEIVIIIIIFTYSRIDSSSPLSPLASFLCKIVQHNN